MTGKSKKLLSTLLVAAMVLGLFAAIPMPARAANTNVAIAQADSVASITTAIQDAINAASNGDTVTVTGSKTGAGSPLSLNIPAGVTVKWGADYSDGGGAASLISLSGAGTFDVTGGTTINTGVGVAIYGDVNSAITVSGGTVRASNNSSTINATGDVTVSGTGRVENTSTGYAIETIGANSTVNVNGGTVSANTDSAIKATDASSTVTISGGAVSAGDFAATIDAAGKVTVSGSSTKVENTGSGSAIDAADNVEVSGGTVSATTGSAIYTAGDVTVSGGTVSATDGTAIEAASAGSTVTVSGGTVEVTGAGNIIKANGNGSTVKVESGTVKAEGVGGIGCTNGNVILSGGTVVVGVIDALTVTNGAVPPASLYPVTITGLPNGTYSNPVANTSGFVMDSTKAAATGYNKAWMPEATSRTYTIVVGGMNYTATGAITAAGPNALNFAPPPATAPGITGPTTMTLTAGYAATSTGVYTITGTAPVTVSKTSGNAAITWNDTTKKLDIAAGLAAGTYPVALKASNGTLPDATLTFTLTVQSGGGGGIVGGSGGNWNPRWLPDPKTSTTGTTPTTPDAPKPAFPVGGEAGKRITVYKYEKLKTTLFRLNKGDSFTALGLATGGKALLIEQEDGQQGYIALKDIGLLFGSPIRAIALKKAGVYTLLDNGKFKRTGYFTKEQTLWIQGIAGKYLINKQSGVTYYLDAAQWMLWVQ